MALDDYIKLIDKYDADELKIMNKRNPPAFRSYFNLMATSANLPRLTTIELHKMREHIKVKLESSSELNTTNESSQSDASQEITTLSIEATRQLDRLSHYCDRLNTHTDQDRELVEELRGFIGHAKEKIDEAADEPEIFYPTIVKDRCHALKEITSQIKANQSLILPVIKLQSKKPASVQSSPDRSPASSPDTISDTDQHHKRRY